MSPSGARLPVPVDEPTGQIPPVPPEARPESRRWGGRRRTALAVVVVIAVAGASTGTWLATRKTSSAAPVTVSTEAAAVTTGTMKQTVSTSGTIEPGSEADLDFAVSGKVTAVDVSSGSKVTKGETLATVDPAALQVEVEAAEASRSSAEDELSSDRSSGASTSQIDSDEASVTSAKIDVTSAQADLADAALKSTMTGTVASVDLTLGEQVSGSSSSSSSGGSSSGASSGGTATGASGGTGGASSTGGSSGATSAGSSSSSSTSSSAQIAVIDTHSYTVATTVDDTEVGQVKVGDQAVITPGSSSATVYGTVSSVGLIASDSSDVATFPVVVAVTGSPGGIYAGASATVSIITKQLDDVVEVATTAITYSGATAEVTLVDGSRHVTTPISTGVSSDGETQVTKGLRVGDKVIERVVKFNGSGRARSLFGGSTGASGGGFGAGGGGFGGGAGGFGGGGGFGG